jgi:transposase
MGETSALQILGELAVLPATLDARQWVAFAGLDPVRFMSGTTVDKKPRISRGGSRHRRRALYMPALVAIRHEPTCELTFSDSWLTESTDAGSSHEKTAACFFRHVPL